MIWRDVETGISISAVWSNPNKEQLFDSALQLLTMMVYDPSEVRTVDLWYKFACLSNENRDTHKSVRREGATLLQ